MALSTQPYKGARDFYPEDKRLQKYLFAVMRQVAERFGYEEYDAPIVEPLEIYAAKTGDEIVNEQTYLFEDRGGRKVVLRPEMTPSVSRMVSAKRQELAYPLRWYSIPNVWRYERPQRGRLREHWQLNVDLFGVDDLQAELETIQVADALLQAYGAKRNMYEVHINSRKLMADVLHDYLLLDKPQAVAVGRLIDRLTKIEQRQFEKQLSDILRPAQKQQGIDKKLNDLLKIKTLAELPPELASHDSVKAMQGLFKMLDKAGVTNASFELSLMRGFDYYTDIVFEIFDADPANNRSMFGGGRYDSLVGLFGVEPVSSVGFGMGDVTLQLFLEGYGLLPQLRTETDIYGIAIGDINEAAMAVISELRQMDLNVAFDFTRRKLDKQIRAAVKKGIRFALFIGEKEIAEEQYRLKDLQTGHEETHSLQRIVSLVKDYRKGI